jgi:hypothetical protein
LKGRPEHFSGAVGTYQIVTDAQPWTVRVEEPVTFTVWIMGHGSPPPRPKLAELPEFKDQFYITDLPAEADCWLFSYTLKPKHEGVKKIPRLSYIYYDPQLRRYQPAHASSIPLEVQPRLRTVPVKVNGTPPALQAPERMFQVVAGSAVLRREQPASLPGPFGLLLLLLLAPPLLCGAWYGIWRRLYPDAARLVRRRRSRAAQEALHALHAPPQPAEVARLAALVAGYLRQRLDLTTAEPTPPETVRHLERMGVSAPLAAQAGSFFAACDAARFAPRALSTVEQLAAEAERLILALEADPCLCDES